MEKSLQDILKQLFDIAKTLSSTLDVDTLLRRIGDAAEQLTDSEASSIMLLDDDKKTLSFKVTTGEKSGILKKLKVIVGQGIAGTIASTKEPMIINDVSKDPRFAGTFDKTSGFQTKQILGVPLLMGDELVGVAEVLNKKDGQEFDNDDLHIMESLGSLATVTIQNARLAEDQKNFFIYIIEVIVQAIESRDPKLTGHTWRVAQLATSIGRLLEIPEPDYKNIYYGSLLHDIGYLAGTRNTNLGGGIMSVQQGNLDKDHPLFGWEIVHKINMLKGAAPIVKSHHENYDGTGYPEKLTGDDIPVSANIVAIAEFVDEQRMNGYANDTINKMLLQHKGKRFRPELIDIVMAENLLPEDESPL